MEIGIGVGVPTGMAMLTAVPGTLLQESRLPPFTRSEWSLVLASRRLTVDEDGPVAPIVTDFWSSLVLGTHAQDEFLNARSESLYLTVAG